MNKRRFRLLVFFMSLSLIGIILVQLYWINTSLEKNDEQFKYHVQQVISSVADKINNKELKQFITEFERLKDSIGKEPETSVLKKILFLEPNGLKEYSEKEKAWQKEMAERRKEKAKQNSKEKKEKPMKLPTN